MAYQQATRTAARRQGVIAWRRCVAAVSWCVVSSGLMLASAFGQQSEPQWIWSPDHAPSNVPTEACYFRKAFALEPGEQVRLEIGADDEFEVFLNGRQVFQGSGWRPLQSIDLTPLVRTADNLLAIQVRNQSGPTAGLVAQLVFTRDGQPRRIVATDGSWMTTLRAPEGWNLASASELLWKPARRLGPFGRTEPWTIASSTDSATDRTPRPLTREPASSTQFRLAREFRIEHLAGHQSVGSLIAMTFDELGRIIVSRENGPLMLIFDQDGDGQLDHIRTYSDQVTNCQGLLALGGEVFAVGDGPEGAGLYRLQDEDADGWLEKATALVRFRVKSIEHGAHAVALGPDGYLYVLLGNHAEVETPLEAGPYRNWYEGDLVQPRFEDPGGHAAGIKAPGGLVLRLDREGKRVEAFAGGLRNPYDLVFNSHGEMFTHDADMESDLGTTWYRPTRVLHVTPGAEFGWRSGWAKWPDYFLDSLPAIADTGRGSPAGVEIYGHVAFPLRFHNALLLADWSEGRIWVCPIRENGAGYTATPQVFLEGQPLNVTDLEVGPDGALYLVTGGRETAGNLYRVSWRGQVPEHILDIGQGIPAVLRQPQLQSAWARQIVSRIKQESAESWNTELRAIAQSSLRSPDERVRALVIMQWFGPQPDIQLLTELSRDPSPRIRAAAAYHLPLAVASANAVRDALVPLLDDSQPVVRRRACEALMQRGLTVDVDKLIPMLAHEDRFEVFAARRLLEQHDVALWKDTVLQADELPIFLHGATALLTAAPSPEHAKEVIARGLELMQGFVSDRDFVSLLRVYQLALARARLQPGDVPELRAALAEEYPATDHTINRELVRLLAYLQVDDITPRYIAHLETLPVSERVHQAMYLARIATGWEPHERLMLLKFLESPAGVGNSVPGYLQGAALRFGQHIPESLTDEVLDAPQEYPTAAMGLVLRMKTPLAADDIERLKTMDEAIRGLQTESGRRLKVAILAKLAQDGSDAALEYLRVVYDRDPQRRVEVAVGLSQKPYGPNWAYLVRSLHLLDNTTAQEVLGQLRKSSQRPSDADPYRQVILCGLRLGENGADEAIALLEHWQGYSGERNVEWEDALRAWQRWFRQRFPDSPDPVLTVGAGASKWDAENLLRELTLSDPTKQGSAARGAEVFVKARCASCHRYGDVGETIGPDLTSLSRRFLVKEILDSILYPSQVISDQYRAHVVVTDSGKMLTGLVSRSAGQITVLTADGQKVQLDPSEVEQMEPSKVSAMPEGLLEPLTLEEIRDLFAYLTELPRAHTARAP